MLNTYIKINDKQIIAGQTSNGVWYCKELPADTPRQLKILIGEVNMILNEYNQVKDEKPKKNKITPPSSSPVSDKVRM